MNNCSCVQPGGVRLPQGSTVFQIPTGNLLAMWPWKSPEKVRPKKKPAGKV